MKSKYIAILSSGTGGHVYPAYTVSQEFIKKGYKILWIGTNNGIENRIVNNKSITIKHISARGIRGKAFTSVIKSIFMFFKSIFQSFIIYNKYKPVLTFGFGGFVSVSGVLVSFLYRIPVIIHEQNSVPGTANKINYFFSKKIFETYPNSFNKNIDKIIHTGNPVRKAFSSLTTPEEKFKTDKSYLNILIIGGSQGSDFFNECLPFVFSHFDNKNISITHLSGLNKSDNVLEKYKKYDLDVKVLDYSDNIEKLYEWSNLIICRSGSTSISEIAKIGRAAILVPFPFATDEHQLKNATFLANQSACMLVKQQETFTEDLVNIINILLNDQRRMYILSKNIQDIFPNDTINIILKETEKILNNIDD